MSKRMVMGILIIIAAVCLMLPGMAGAELTATPITLNTEMTVDSSVQGGVGLFSFTPTETAIYKFWSYDSSRDPYGYLLDSEMETITASDDYNSLDFRIQEKLEAGQTYYFAATLLDERQTDSFKVKLEKLDGIYLWLNEYDGLVQVDLGETATMYLDAFSTAGELTYQWYQVSGETETAIDGATTSEYTCPALTSNGEVRKYKCVVRDAQNRTESLDYTVVVGTEMTLTKYPEENIYVPYNSNEATNLEIEATTSYGTVTYRWEKSVYNNTTQDWEFIPVSNTDTLSLRNITEMAEYRCIATDVNGYSRDAWFAVRVEHDDFTLDAAGETNLQVTAGQSINLAVTPLTTEENEPFTYSYNWWRMDEDGYEYEIPNPDNNSTITITPIESGTYYCCADDGCGNSTEPVMFNVTVTSDMTAVADGATEITAVPDDSVQMKVTASSTAQGAITYQWYERNRIFERNIPIPNATNAIYTIDPLQSAGTYVCRAKDASGVTRTVTFTINVDNGFQAERIGEQERYLIGGEQTTLAVNASSTDGVLIYRWYKLNGNQFARDYTSTGSSITVTGTEKDDYYRCKVSDRWGNSKTFEFYIHPMTPPITLSTPSLYVKTTESTGFMIDLIMPEGFNAPLSSWSVIVMDQSNNATVYSKSSQAGDTFTRQMIVPKDSLVSGKKYQISVYLQYEGYRSYSYGKAFEVIDAATNPSITVELTDNRGEIPDRVLSNNNYAVRITGGSNIKALRVWMDGYWDSVTGNSFSMSIWPAEGTHVWYAYGTEDEPAGEDWENTVEWTAASTVLQFNAIKLGTLAKPVISLDQEEGAYTIGTPVTVSMARVTNAENYHLSIYQMISNGPDRQVYYDNINDEQTSGENVSFTIPTDHMESGRYYLTVNISAPGYDGAISEEKTFALSGSAPADAVIRILPETTEGLWIGEPVYVYAYDPNSEDLELVVRKADGMTSSSIRNETGEKYTLDSSSHSMPGWYIAYLYEDGEETPVATAEFHVQSMGRFEQVSIQNAPSILQKGNDYTLSFNQVENAESYDIYLYYEEEDGSSYVLSDREIDASANDPITVTFPGDIFQTYGNYYVSIYPRGRRLESNNSSKYFTVVDSNTEWNDDVEIQVQMVDYEGHPITETDRYPGQNFYFRVTATNAAEVRLWTGRTWVECTLDENGSWTSWDYYYTTGSYSAFAQGRSAQSETWDAISNILSFRYIERTLPGGTFTHDITDGSVTRGQEIHLTVGADPEPAEGEESFSGLSYSGRIYTKYGTTEGWLFAYGWSEESREIVIPTDNLTPGKYRIYLADSAYGWFDGISEGYAEFTITEPAVMPAPFRVNVNPAEEQPIGKPIGAIYYHPGAEYVGIRINRDGSYYNREYCNRDIGRWEWTFNDPGEYTLTPYAEMNDGTTVDGTPIVLTVVSYGDAEKVTFVAGTPAMAVVGQNDMTLSFTKPANVTEYKVELEDTDGWDTIFRENLEPGTGNTMSVTLDKTLFTSEKVYSLTVYTSAPGYTQNQTQLYIPVINMTGNEQAITLQTLDRWGQPTNRTEWYTAEDVRFHIDKPAGATEIRLWNGHNWYTDTITADGWNLRTNYQEGNIVAFAQTRGETGDWNTISNVVRLHISKRTLDAPVFTTSMIGNSLNRGDLLEVTIGEEPDTGETVEPDEFSYYARICRIETDEDQNEAETSITESSWERETRQILLPTEACTAGNYRLYVNVGAYGWEGKEVSLNFQVTDDGTAIAPLRISKTEIPIYDTADIHVYLPDTESYEYLRVWYQREEDSREDYLLESYRSEMAYKRWQPTEAGHYTLMLKFYDENYNEISLEGQWPTIQVNVTSEGKLEEVQPTMARVLQVNSDLDVSFAKVAKATEYSVYLYQSDYGNVLYSERLEPGEGETINLHIDKKYLTEAGAYYLLISAYGTGYLPSDHYAYFVVLEPTSDSVTLQMLDDGEVTTRTEWFTAEAIYFRVVTSADEVRLWNGSEWRYYTPTDGVWEDSFRFNEGSHSVVAQTRTGDGDWNATSAVLNLQFTRREVPAPTYTHNISGGSITRGEILRITLTDQPITDNAPTDGYQYYAHVYKVQTDGEEGDEWVCRKDMDLKTQQIVIPTDKLTAEQQYRLEIHACLNKWDDNVTIILFTVIEPTEAPANFRISKTDLLVNETVEVVFYAPGAQRIQFYAQRQGESYMSSEGQIWDELMLWTWKPGMTGTYLLIPEAYDSNDQLMTGGWEPIEVTVTKEGDLENAQLTQALPTIAELGKPLTIQFNGIEYADRYHVELARRVYPWSFNYVAEWNIDAEEGADTYSVTIPGEKLDTRGGYRVIISAEGVGYTFSMSPFNFAAFEEGVNILRLPSGLTRIEDNAFENGAFEIVIIPESCNYVGSGAFQNCSNLCYVIYPSGMYYEADSFSGCPIEDWGWDAR